MKFNAHLLQSQKDVGDIGSGTSIFDDTMSDNWTDRSTYIMNRSVPTSASETLVKDIPYKNEYINKIFSAKPITNGYNYGTYYSDSYTPVVQIHELPTMGQVAHYLLAPKASTFNGGVITKYVGDHIKNTGSTIDNTATIYAIASRRTGSQHNETTWNENLSLADKVRYFFNEIIDAGDDSTPGAGYFNLKARHVNATEIVATSQNVVLGNYEQLYAGSVPGGKSGTSFIFRVGNTLGVGAEKPRSILLDQTAQKAGAPVGIHGTFKSSESLENIKQSEYSFIDVDRYILRRSDKGRRASFGNFTNMQMSDTGSPQFINRDSTDANVRTIQIPLPLGTTPVTSNVILDRPIIENGSGSGMQNIYLYQGLSYSGWKYNFINNSSITYSNTYGVSDIIEASMHFDNIKMYFNYVGNNYTHGYSCLFLDDTTVYNINDYRFMRNQGEQTMYNFKHGTNANYFSGFLSMDRLWGTEGIVRLGTWMPSINQSRFSIAQTQALNELHYCAMPLLNSKSTLDEIANPSYFVVTRPSSKQIITTGLRIEGGSSVSLDITNANITSEYINNINTSSSVKVEDDAVTLRVKQNNPTGDVYVAVTDVDITLNNTNSGGDTSYIKIGTDYVDLVSDNLKLKSNFIVFGKGNSIGQSQNAGVWGFNSTQSNLVATRSRAAEAPEGALAYDDSGIWVHTNTGWRRVDI